MTNALQITSPPVSLFLVPCLQCPTDPNTPPNIYPAVATGLKEVNEVDLSWEKKRECVKEAI